VLVGRGVVGRGFGAWGGKRGFGVSSIPGTEATEPTVRRPKC